ncbi:hypothetical protein GTW98_15525 [Streptomyces sp. SID8375]|uniref:hypothetical protein n=1 Tax=Streptomyces TaxID=1883 RepID=UPI00037CBAC5|nr:MULTISPECIES: hypothetical protein [unclassified Streptomyces]MCW7984791.1 hypothetical protein [Streptomyces platensis subsp. clarensis]MYT11023.1 hypothetical protein [Streptomyces sp. SID4951]MYX08194.1 hypothetical protein [Streptomyces sp. SID8375]SCK06049.1 hypothetical protein YWIDRAFT_00192 [Streptomyces sp. SceaMP-e96]
MSKFRTRVISGAVAGLALTAGTVGLASPAAAAGTAPPCVIGMVDGASGPAAKMAYVSNKCDFNVAVDMVVSNGTDSGCVTISPGRQYKFRTWGSNQQVFAINNCQP